MNKKIEDKLDIQLNHNLNLISTYLERNTIEEYKEIFSGDPVFEIFGLTDDKFLKKRIIAGLANSIATNLGRFTDKATKIIFTEAFNIPMDQFLVKIEIDSNGKKEIEEVDGFITFDNIPESWKKHFDKSLQQYHSKCKELIKKPIGFGFEFRGRYGKNDDSLLQKDEHMSSALLNKNVIPVLGIFSTSNAQGSIKRLQKSWLILTGHETTDFIKELTDFDLIAYLQSRKHKIDKVMKIIES